MIFFSVMNKLPWNAGLYMLPGWKVYPTLYFCKSVQTTTYEVVNASYVPTAQTKEEKEIKVLLCVIFIFLSSFKNIWKKRIKGK